MPRNISMLTKTSVQLVIGLFLGLAVVLVCEATLGNLDLGTGTLVHSIGNTTIVRISDPAGRLEIRLRGDVEMLADGRGVARIGPGSQLRLSHKTAAGRRRLEVVRNSDGQPEYNYRQGHRKATFDAAARAWLTDSMVHFYRASGVDSERRVALLLASGGPPAVLAEVLAIAGDRVQGIYLLELLQQSNQPTTTAQVLNCAIREIGSNYGTRRLLWQVDSQQLTNPGVRDAYRRLALATGSDYEIRHATEALATVAEHPLEPVPQGNP